jgi:hypothetical protein
MGEGLLCISIWVPSLPGPSFVHIWCSVCCLFCISHFPQLVSKTSLCETWEVSIYFSKLSILSIVIIGFVFVFSRKTLTALCQHFTKIQHK